MIDAPQAKEADEVVVDVLAAGLHPRVRSGASGSHYASGTVLPLVPGIDGVGRLTDGQRVYFLALDAVHGSMAEQAVVRRVLCFPLPDQADDVMVAAGMNPAMSSWVPLRHRVQLQSGQEVLVLGATGSAGRMAVQIAKRLGAGRVVGVGRDPERLAELGALGADSTVSLMGSSTDVGAAVGAAASDIDVVIDYLWGPPAEAVMADLFAARSNPGRPLTWLHIGAVAGSTMALPSVALRAHNLTIVGSGQGSMSTADIAADMPALIDELAMGRITIDAVPVPLADVEAIWDAPASRERRVVLCP
jgi:NADPH:quinone reductase-like Zn-dependent oxidoreductase